MLALKGKQNEVLCMVKEAVKLNSHDPRVRSLQGGVLALAGQKDQAICELNEAIRLDRRDSWTYGIPNALQRSSGNSMEAANKDYEQVRSGMRSWASALSTSMNRLTPSPTISRSIMHSGKFPNRRGE